jgi:hypothetical protein
MSLIPQPRAAHADGMYDGFWKYCVAQAVSGTAMPRDGLAALSADQINELSNSLGFTAVPEATWASDDGAWFIIDMQRGEIGNCAAMSITTSLDANVSEWNASLPDSFRSKSAAELSSVSPSRRAGGWATTRIDDGFVQISLSNIAIGENPPAIMALLTAVRVGNTPASCELYPMECD